MMNFSIIHRDMYCCGLCNQSNKSEEKRKTVCVTPGIISQVCVHVCAQVFVDVFTHLENSLLNTIKKHNVRVK